MEKSFVKSAMANNGFQILVKVKDERNNIEIPVRWYDDIGCRLEIFHDDWKAFTHPGFTKLLQWFADVNDDEDGTPTVMAVVNVLSMNGFVDKTPSSNERIEDVLKDIRFAMDRVETVAADQNVPEPSRSMFGELHAQMQKILFQSRK